MWLFKALIFKILSGYVNSLFLAFRVFRRRSCSAVCDHWGQTRVYAMVPADPSRCLQAGEPGAWVVSRRI